MPTRRITIRSVRESLAEQKDRDLFQNEIESTPGHRLVEVLLLWDARAHAYTCLPDDPEGPEDLVSDEEVYVTLPELRSLDER